jgi:hypothetical protein
LRWENNKTEKIEVELEKMGDLKVQFLVLFYFRGHGDDARIDR